MFDRPSCHAPMFHPLNALTCSVKLFLIALRSNITGQLGQKTKKQNLLCTAVPKCAYWCHPIIYIPKYFFFFVSHLYLRPQGTEVVHFLHYVASRLWCSVHQNNVGIYFKLSTTQLWAESHSGLKKTTKKNPLPLSLWLFSSTSDPWSFTLLTQILFCHASLFALGGHTLSV